MVVQSGVKLINPGLASTLNSLLIHNNVDSSKLFSLNNLTLATLNCHMKLAAVSLLNKRIRNLGQHLTQG